MSDKRLPPLTQESLLHVDAFPDESYPLRILKAYRHNCDCMWADNTTGEESMDPLLVAMNEDNQRRAAILDKAITRLEEAPYEPAE